MIGKLLELYEDYYGCWQVASHQSKSHNGYKRFVRDGKSWRIHRYMYQKYIGEIPINMCVCHKCDHPGCVNPKHLFLGTSADNRQDASRKGRLKGRGNIKLTKKEVKEIRLAKGTQREICKQYGISQHHVSDIKNRLSWAWL